MRGSHNKFTRGADNDTAFQIVPDNRYGHHKNKKNPILKANLSVFRVFTLIYNFFFKKKISVTRPTARPKPLPKT
jgi:hypothetical protein